MSNTPPPAKKLRVKDENKDNCLTENSKSTAVVAKIDNVDAAALNKTKIIKIDAKQLVNLTANKKLIISRQKQLNSSDNEVITQTENVRYFFRYTLIIPRPPSNFFFNYSRPRTQPKGVITDWLKN